MHFTYTPLSLAVLAILSPMLYAQEQNISIEKEISVSLLPLISQAEKNEIGTQVYHQQQLQNMPNSSKSISDFLKLNPNVHFGRDSESAGKQASLAPEEISIHGAPSFSNKFVLDGVNTSNTFDPVGEGADSHYYGFPSNSQTANINTDLLCNLSVIDSNASAEHSQFQGGVISAETCAPTTPMGQLHGTISYDYTSDSWSRFNYVDTEEELAFETNQDTSHPKEYTTQGLSSSVYARVNEQWGFNAFAATRNSRIPVMSGFGQDEKVKTQEQNDNFGLTLYFNPNDKNSYQFGVQHYDYKKEGYYQNVIESNYDIDTVASTLFFNAKNQFNHFTLNQNFNYRTSELERNLLRNSSTAWTYAEGSKDWRDVGVFGTLTEGGFGGNLINQQATLNYDLKATFNPLSWAQTLHKIKVGGGYQHNKGAWQRPDEMLIYTTRSNLGKASCAIGDLQCDEADLQYRASSTKPVEDWTGQYSTAGVYYSAGKFTARQDQWSVFAEDEMTWKKLRTRIGLRGDYDSLASNFNIAPRFNLEYSPFEKNALRLSTGVNRYYGNVFLMTELDEQAHSTQASLSRPKTYSSTWDASNDYGWSKNFPTSQAAAVKANDVDTPYSDELMFAIDGQWQNLSWGLKWVQRDFEDQIAETRIFKTNANGASVLDYRTFANRDGGDAQTYTLSLNTLQPLTLFKTQHDFGLGLSYLEKNTLIGTYKTADNNTLHDLIYLNGQVLSYNMLPTKDAPFTARFNWNIKSSTLPISLNNFFYYRDGSTNYVKTLDQIEVANQMLAVYEERDFASKFRWDARASYVMPVAKDQSLTFGLTVHNVLNKANKAVKDNGEPYSEEGRRFIADVSFKF